MSSTRPKKVAFALKEFNEDVKTANVYVVFKDPAHVQAALQLNGEKVGSTRMFVCMFLTIGATVGWAYYPSRQSCKRGGL